MMTSTTLEPGRVGFRVDRVAKMRGVGLPRKGNFVRVTDPTSKWHGYTGRVAERFKTIVYVDRESLHHEPLHPGDRVRVRVDPVGDDRRWRGQVGTLDRLTKPHGYAVVRLDSGSPSEVFLHPESLIKEDA